MIRQEMKRILRTTQLRLIFFSVLVIMIIYAVGVSFSQENTLYKLAYESYQEHEEESNHGFFDANLQAVTTYTDSILDALDNINAKLELPLFLASASLDSLMQQQEIYELLVDIEPVLTPNYLATSIIESPVIVGLAMVWGLSLVYFLFIQDIQTKMIELFEATSLKRKHLFWSKVLVFELCLGVLMSLVVSISILSQVLDQTNIQAPIQSLQSFTYFPYPLTILTYQLYLYLLRFLAVSLVSLLTLMFYLVFRKLQAVLTLIIIVLFASFLLSSFISITSSLSNIKYLNLYYLLFGIPNTIQFIWKFLLQSATFTCALLLLILIICTTYHLYCHNIKYRSTLWIKPPCFKSILSNELYRIMITHKGMVILLLLCTYFGYKYVDYQITNTVGASEFAQIQKEYLGSVDTHTLESLNVLIEASNEAQTQYQCIMDGNCPGYNDETIVSELVATITNGNYASIIRDEIQSVIDNGGNYYVVNDGFDYFLGEYYIMNLVMNLLIFSCALILVVSASTAILKQYRFDSIFNATPIGQKQLQRLSISIYYVYEFIVLGALWILYILKLQKVYPIMNNYPLNVLVNTQSTLNLYSYLWVHFGIMILFGALVINIARLLAQYFDMIIASIGSIFFVLLCIVLLLVKPELSMLYPLLIDALNSKVLMVTWIAIIAACILLSRFYITKSKNS